MILSHTYCSLALLELGKDQIVCDLYILVLHENYPLNAYLSFVLCRYVFDTSLLKGGAPGRTRGLNVYAIDPFTEGLNGLKQVKGSTY